MNVFKLGRKVLTMGTVFSTILWSVGVAALVPAVVQADTCPTFKSGDLLKVAGHPAIYAVDSNGKVLYFPSGDEFKSWNSNDKYGGYTTISQSCYDSLPVPTQAPLGVNFRPGSFVVKRPSSDQLYVVEPNNTLAKITPDAAKALYGASYKVKTVADVFWPNYGSTRGADVTEATAHPGMLVSNGGKTYYVNTDGTYSEVTATGFTANRFKTAFVHPVSSIGTVGATIDALIATVADRTQTGGGSSVIPGTNPTSTPVSGGNVQVALASDNPAGAILAGGTAFNPVLKVTLTGGSTGASITGLTLTKSGFAANNVVSGADVVDSKGVRHGNVASSVDSNNNLTLLFSSQPVVVNAGATETLTVRINLASTANAGTLQFSIPSASAITANGTISGNFPVTGNIFTIQAGNTIAGVTVAPLFVGTSTLNIDPVNEQDITKFQLSANSNEDVKLVKWTLYDNGTAADTSVQDVMLVSQAGTVLATAQQVNKTVTFDLSATPFTISKGTTQNFTVRSKIVGGANTTVNFTTYNNYDIVVTGAASGVSVLPTAVSGSFPIGTGFNTITVGSGSLSFNKDVSSPSGSVTPGSNGVVLAKYYAKPVGENMELRQVSVGFVTNTPSLLTGSYVIRVNGQSVWSDSVANVVNSASAGSVVTLSSYPILTAGQNNYITVEANIMSNAASTGTVTAYLDTTQVRRVTTNDIIDPGTNYTAGNQITVQAGALKVTNLATPVAASVVVGSTGVPLATFELNAGAVSSGEDVKVSKIVVTVSSTGAATSSNIGNLVLYDANGNPLATSNNTATISGNTVAFNFVTPIVVPKSGLVALTLKGDVLTGTSGTVQFGINNASTDVTAVGVSTGNTVTASAGVGIGQAMTIAPSGSLYLSSVTGGNAAPSANQNVIVGTTNVPVFALKLTAANEPMKVTSLKLTATGTLSTLNDLVNIRLSLNPGGTSPFATAGQLNAGATTASATYTWTATDNLLPAAVQPGSPVTVYVVADVGPAGSIVLGDNFRFGVASTSDVLAKGAASAVTSTATGAPFVTGITYIEPQSVAVSAVAPIGNQTLAVVAGTQLGTFKITNNGTARVTVTGLKVTDNGAHTGSTTYFKLSYSDQNSSNYTQYTASSSQGEANNVIDFSGLASGFTIDGGASRYVTVSVAALGGSLSNDTYALSIASIGDVKYTAVGTDLGYDPKAQGNLGNTSNSLSADGQPTLAILTKQ